MSNIFISEEGNEIRRYAGLDTAGAAVVKGLKKNSEYQVDIRNTNVYNYPKTRNEFIMLNANPTSYEDITQVITTPDADSTINLNWTKYYNHSYIELWNEFKELVNNNNNNINYDTFTEIGDEEFGNYKYSGGVLLPDGRALFVPWSASQTMIFDPITLSLTKVGPIFDITVQNKYFNGVLLPDNNRILFIPVEGRKAAIFNLSDYSLEEFGDPLGAGFSGGIQMADGRIIMIPGMSTQPAIIDPIAKTLTKFGPIENPPGNRPIDRKYGGGVLLPDGRIFMTNMGGYQAAILDVEAETITKIGPVDTRPVIPEGGRYGNGRLLPNGEEVLMVPYLFANRLVIVNFKTMSYREVGPILSENPVDGGRFGGTVSLADGRILLISDSYYYNMIFDPKDESVTHFGPKLVNEDGFKYDYYQGGTLLQDGRILLYNQYKLKPLLISASDGNYGNLPNLDICLSSYLNHF